jgi:hypothetical protein
MQHAGRGLTSAGVPQGSGGEVGGGGAGDENTIIVSMSETRKQVHAAGL